MILYLFCKSGFVAASDCRETLRAAGDLRIECGLSDGYAIMPLDFIIDEAYFL